MRRRRDRYLKRRGEFMDKRLRHGLMPADPAARKELEKLDPWNLRVRGLDEPLTLHELGRALFHLQQRRGFKSNRKTDAGADDEKGKIKSAAAKVRLEMVGTDTRTFGELLARPRFEDPKAAHNYPVRARLRGQGAKAFYDFYPTRDLIAEEFGALWKAQQRFHGEALPNAAYEDLCDTLLFQRPLKPQPIGKCSLDPSEERASRALPSQQRLRIYQEINHLQVREPGKAFRPLTLQERDILATKALNTAKLTFESARKTLILSPDARFNYENDSRRKHLDGDKTAALLASNKRWSKDWRSLDSDEQEEIVERLLAEQDETQLTSWLQCTFGLSAESILAVSNANLPAGHGRLGRTATARVLEWLCSGQEQAADPRSGEIYTAPFTYDQSVRLAGYLSHSDLDFDGEVFDELPYYGEVLERHVAFGTGEPDDPLEKRIGKIANPTVHVALNELRKVVNVLMKRFGPPAEIAVELARDLPLSAKGKTELEREQKANQEANEKRRDELKRLGHPDNYENRLRLRLWEELNPLDSLDRRCPYTGEQIGIDRVFSEEVETEHILPFSRTLDVGIGNKTLSMRQANRDKGQRSPFEAFGSSPHGYDWNMISRRTANLPANKAWRFGPDAMQRFENEERDFLARHLNETRYAARLARFYLQRTGADVWVTPGRLTADLRWTWGLDSILSGHNREEAVDPAKNRNDHRHHAIDAIVVALTHRSLLQRVATAARSAEEKFDRRLLAGLEDPWTDFRNHVRDSVLRIIVSHKPDHGVQGALHNDTAYGIVEGPDAKGRSQVVHRIPLDSLKRHADLAAIRDPLIREHLMVETEGLEGRDFREALVLDGVRMEPPVRRVRILEKLRVIPISDRRTGKPYKAYKGDNNYCYDIFLGTNGRWSGEVVSRFSANKFDFDPHAKASRNGAPLIMRLRQNDLVSTNDGLSSEILRVVKFSPGQIVLAPHYEGGALKGRDTDKADPFKYVTTSPGGLQAQKARLVRVDSAGRIFDPGPPE